MHSQTSTIRKARILTCRRPWSTPLCRSQSSGRAWPQSPPSRCPPPVSGRSGFEGHDQGTGDASTNGTADPAAAWDTGLTGERRSNAHGLATSPPSRRPRCACCSTAHRPCGAAPRNPSSCASWLRSCRAHAHVHVRTACLATLCGPQAVCTCTDSVRAPPHPAGRLCRVLQACMAASSRRRISHKPVVFDDRQLQTLAAAAAAHFSQAPLRNLVA